MPASEWILDATRGLEPEEAQAVVDAAPGYTARGERGGSVWKLDHALDALRDVLAPGQKGAADA